MKIRFYPQLNRDIGDVEFETEKDWVNFVTAIKAKCIALFLNILTGVGLDIIPLTERKRSFFFPN